MRAIPDEAAIAVAKAICLAELGDAASFGEMRCCQVGGIDGCCLASYVPIAEKAIVAYLLHEESPMTDPTNPITTVVVTDGATRRAALDEIDRLHAAPRHSADAALGRQLKKAVTRYDEAQEKQAGGERTEG